MNNSSKIFVYVAVGLIALLASAYYFIARNRNAGTDAVMLLDDSATPARHALIRLQEQPVFHEDDRKRSFAMLDDLDARSGKTQARDRPSAIQELKQ